MFLVFRGMRKQFAAPYASERRPSQGSRIGTDTDTIADLPAGHWPANRRSGVLRRDSAGTPHGRFLARRTNSFADMAGLKFATAHQALSHLFDGRAIRLGLFGIGTTRRHYAASLVSTSIA